LVLFFRKEQESSFSEEKEAKRLLLSGVALTDPGLGRIATRYQWVRSRAGVSNYLWTTRPG
jgi:hypothetical protein